jgi:hypothetical protein
MKGKTKVPFELLKIKSLRLEGDSKSTMGMGGGSKGVEELIGSQPHHYSLA